MPEDQKLLRLCRLDEVEEDEPLQVEMEGEAYAVFRVGDNFYVLADSCTHGPGLVSDGYADGDEVECPFHGGRFKLSNGAPAGPPCTDPVNAWTPILRDEDIFIDLNQDDLIPETQ